MGVFQRIVLIMKGYLSAASDRVERVATEEESRLAKARKQALEELKGLSSTDIPSTSIPTAPASTRTAPQQARLTADYRMLGIAPGSDLETVETAWRELARRADPKRFPSGSEEEKKAAEILRSVNDAYARIREAMNPTEGRFGRLEF